MRLGELKGSVRTRWPSPAALIFLGFGSVSGVGCWLFPASEESHGRDEDGEGTGGELGGGERDETADLRRP